MTPTFTTTSIMSVRDVKTLVTRLLHCHKRGHLIIMPYLAPNGNDHDRLTLIIMPYLGIKHVAKH